MAYDSMMAEMGMAAGKPWSAADAFFTFCMWAVMMVGMMGGAAWPVLLLFANARAGRGERGVPVAVLAFDAPRDAVWNLLLDFDFIESGARSDAPKYMEWYGAFGLMVTLVWLYLELLRLLSKLRSR